MVCEREIFFFLGLDSPYSLHHPAVLIYGFVSWLLSVVEVFTFQESLQHHRVKRVEEQLNWCTDAWLCKGQPPNVAFVTTFTMHYNGSHRASEGHLMIWLHAVIYFGVTTFVRCTYTTIQIFEIGC